MAEGSQEKEKYAAWGAMLTSASLSGLAFVAEQLKWEWPPLVVYGVLAASAVSGIVAFALFARILFWAPKYKWISQWKFSFSAEDWLPFRRLIPLTDAVHIAYDQTQGSDAAFFAEQEGYVGYFAHALWHEGKVQLYGVKPGTSRLQKISSDLHGSISFSDDASKIHRFGDRDTVLFENVSILKKDLHFMIKEIRTWGPSGANN